MSDKEKIEKLESEIRKLRIDIVQAEASNVALRRALADALAKLKEAKWRAPQ